MENDFPVDSFNRLAEKMSDFIDVQLYEMENEPDTRSNRKKDKKQPTQNAFSRVMVDRLRDMNTSIDGLTKAVSERTRITESRDPLTTHKSVSNIENATNNINNNTEVIWEESAEMARRQNVNFNMIAGLLKEVIDPIKSLAYRFSDNMFEPAMEPINATPVFSQSFEPTVTRFTMQQLILMQSQLVESKNIKSILKDNLSGISKQTNTTNQALKKMYAWLMLNGKYEKRQYERDGSTSKKRNTKDTEMFYGMNLLLTSIQKEMVDMNALMGARNMMNAISGVWGGMGKGGRLIGRVAGSAVVGSMIMDSFKTLLDGVQANTPSMVSDIVKDTRSVIDGTIKSIFGGLSDDVENILLGAGAIGLTEVAGKSLFKFAKAAIPAAMETVSAVFLSPEFMALAAGVGVVLLAQQHKDTLSKYIDDAISSTGELFKTATQYIQDGLQSVGINSNLVVKEHSADSITGVATDKKYNISDAEKELFKQVFQDKQIHQLLLKNAQDSAKLKIQDINKIISNTKMLSDHRSDALAKYSLTNAVKTDPKIARFIVEVNGGKVNGQKLKSATDSVEKAQQDVVQKETLPPLIQTNSSNVNTSNTTVNADPLTPLSYRQLPRKNNGTGLYE